MTRIGTGYDLHRLEAGRPLVLGGVLIPHDRGLTGHSDADAVAHAITDALLGAAALGDIGGHYPDTDPEFENADSVVLLARTRELLARHGFVIGNVDATIIAQEPRLRPHVEAMRTNLAEALQLPVDRVSVKAKTNEGMGPEGRREAISVHAVALIDET